MTLGAFLEQFWIIVGRIAGIYRVLLDGVVSISFVIWIVYRKAAFVFSVTLLQENLADLMPHLLSFLKLPLRSLASRWSPRQGARQNT